MHRPGVHRPWANGGVTHIERSSAESTQKQTFATLPPNRSKNRRTYRRLFILAPAGPPRSLPAAGVRGSTVRSAMCAARSRGKPFFAVYMHGNAIVPSWLSVRACKAPHASRGHRNGDCHPVAVRQLQCSEGRACVPCSGAQRAKPHKRRPGGAAKNLEAGAIAVVQRRLGCRLILGIKPRPHLRAKCVCVPQANPSSWAAAAAHATHRIVPRRVQRQARPAARAKAKRGARVSLQACAAGLVPYRVDDVHRRQAEAAAYFSLCIPAPSVHGGRRACWARCGISTALQGAGSRPP